MQLQTYLRMLQRGWWIIALAGLSAVVVALVVSYNTTPVYRASARFIVSPNADIDSSRDVISSLSTLDKRSIAATYAEILDSDRISSDTGTALGIEPSVLGQYRLSTTVLPEANILELSAIGPNPEVAAAIANSAGQQGITYIRNIDRVYTVSLLDAASVPSKPLNPKPVRDASLALVLGLAAGAALVLLREQLQAPFDELRQRTRTEPLSSAHTRQFAQSRMEEHIQADKGPIAFGLVHLDGLDTVLQTATPADVRKVLQHVTTTVRDEVRGRDVVARWNATTFALVFPQMTSAAANALLERIRDSLSRPIERGPHGAAITLAPRTVAVARQADETTAQLVARAEASLANPLQRGVTVPSLPNSPQALT